MKSVKPISPEQITFAKIDSIPPEVFETFNELIVKNWNGHSSTVRQEDIVKEITRKVGWERAKNIYPEHWLDVEGFYRAEGWDVDYDKPGYNESYYEPYFTFRKKRK